MQQFKFKINCYQLVNEGDISPTSPDPIERIILKKRNGKMKIPVSFAILHLSKKRNLNIHMKKMQPLDLILFVAKCRAAATLRRYDNKCGHCHCQLQFIKKFANHTEN